MADHILEARKAMVSAMRGNAALVSLVSKDTIYGEEAAPGTPWPFILCGLPTETPQRASCWDGSSMSAVVHCFARGPNMDKCSAIVNAIKRALDEMHVVRSGIAITIQHAQSQIIRDGAETSDYHGIVRFDIDCLEAS